MKRLIKKYMRFFWKFSESLTILGIIFLLIARGKAFASSIDDLMANLHSNDQQIQLLAVEELGKMKDERAIDALLQLVVNRGEDWRIKIKAIRLLGEIADQKVSDKLVTIFNNPFLNEECPAIQWNTAIALGKKFNKGSRAVDSLIGAINHYNLLVREAVIQSLGRIGDSRAVPFLILALHDKRVAIKFSAIKALENIGDPRAIPFLKQIAENDSDPYVKGEAHSVIKRLSTGRNMIGQ
jgi:HEAT repeat protein